MFATCGISWQSAIDKALPCLDVALTTFPQLEDELKGLADGSGTDLNSLAALNCRTEILPPDYLSRATGLAPETLPDTGHLTECTSLAFQRNDGPTWLAQNWDWIGRQRDSLILLEANFPDQTGYMTVTEAGMLAKIGLNRHGLGITLNILRSARDGAAPGMPVHLFLRGLLELETVEEATALAESVSFASSSNFMVADKHGSMASIEASPLGAKILDAKILDANNAQPEKRGLCHTNHFLHDELTGIDTGLKGNISTESRLAKATELLPDSDDLDSITQLLSNTSDGLQSICRFPDTSLPAVAQVETVVAVAINMTERQLWLSAAQPSITPLLLHQLH